MSKKQTKHHDIVLPKSELDQGFVAWSAAVDRFEPTALAKLTRETLKDAYTMAKAEADWHAQHLDDPMFQKFYDKAKRRYEAAQEAMRIQDNEDSVQLL